MEKERKPSYRDFLDRQDMPYYLRNRRVFVGYDDDRFKEVDGAVVFTPRSDYEMGNEINGRLFGWTNLYSRVTNSEGKDVPLLVINPRLIGDGKKRVIAHEKSHHEEGGRNEDRVRQRTYTEETWKFDNNISYN